MTAVRGESRRFAISRDALEIAVYAALGAVALGQWSRLVVDPPLGRYVLVLAVIAIGAAALRLLARSRRRRPALVAAAGVGALTVGLAVAAAGVPVRLLLPGNWAELIDGLSLGLAGIEDTPLPYEGGDRWLRLTLLLGGPLLLSLGAVIGFWPAARRAPLRIPALAAAIGVYTIAVTLDSPTAELLWGIPVLVLAVAWLWAARLPGRAAVVGLAVAAAAGLIALPAAAAVADDEPWWNYESWDWFKQDREVGFDWDHSYGPLDWPQEGTTLLDVRSSEPLYWKASVLDRFDGLGWQRAREEDPMALAEIEARRTVPGRELGRRNRDWLIQSSFEVEALTSDVAITAGTPLALEGISDVVADSDGVLRTEAGLESGDEYAVLSYAPRPGPAQLRAAPPTYPAAQFADQVTLAIPEAGAPAPARQMPLWGERDPSVDAAWANSPYSEVYELARGLTGQAEHPYEAALAVEDHLRERYDYSTEVPESTFSLATFIDDERTGYCQQFAGSMALMLRMVGIPSRVVSGFAPGSFDAERGVYEVRDTDAHAWVEVYFRGIGWVVFDPTPSAAPAASRTPASELDPTGAARAREQAGASPQLENSRLEGPDFAGGSSAAPDDDGLSAPVVVVLLLLATAIVAGAVTLVRWRRRRRALESGSAVEAQVAELWEGLRALDWSVERGATLTQLEDFFDRPRRRPIARYAAKLRETRYARVEGRPPGPAERRALRRALASDRGLRGWLLALRAVPPGGPRTHP